MTDRSASTASPAPFAIPSPALSDGTRVNARLIDWIWHVRGSVALAPGQSSDDAFRKLAPLFDQTGTSHERTGDTLTFRKKDQAAQDKMAIFDHGTLRIEQDAAGPVLRYNLISRALLACFLAPLLFLAFAQFSVVLNLYEKPTAAEAAAKKKKEEEAEKKKAGRQLHAIDKALGAPAPEKPKKDEKSKKDKEKNEGDHSPTPAYVFAALFAALFLAGRILEDRLVKALFRKSLLGP